MNKKESPELLKNHMNILLFAGSVEEKSTQSLAFKTTERGNQTFSMQSVIERI
jgi:hypothetical protein